MSNSDKKKSLHHKYAPNVLEGSTCGPTRRKYKEKIGEFFINLPRLRKNCQPGTVGNTLVNHLNTVQMAVYAEKLTIHWEKLYNLSLLPVLEKAKTIIPFELRYRNTFWTSLTLVGDIKDGNNHEQKDSNDVASLVIMLGDDISGGDTMYFNGGIEFNRRRIKETRVELEHATTFKHGRYQVCDFDKIVHSGCDWTGKRGVISFFLGRNILHHFEKYGDKFYFEARNRMDG
eukprot:15329830-Ditylum_brightwellii.AAC.1